MLNKVKESLISDALTEMLQQRYSIRSMEDGVFMLPNGEYKGPRDTQKYIETVKNI